MKKKAKKRVVSRASKKHLKEEEPRRIKKRYLKSRPICKVTFRLPKEAAPEAGKVNIVGDFNNWDSDILPMKRLKTGDFTTTVELQPGRKYHFKYLIDGNRWENDWFADIYVPNPYGGDDSVIVL